MQLSVPSVVFRANYKGSQPLGRTLFIARQTAADSGRAPFDIYLSQISIDLTCSPEIHDK